jgi:hypothetical protein
MRDLPDPKETQLRLRADKARFDARLAFLDSRNVRAKLLNREADRLDKEARKLKLLTLWTQAAGV